MQMSLSVSCTFHQNFQLFQFRTRWTAGAWSLVKKCNRQSCSESLDLSTLLCAEFIDNETMTFYLFLSVKYTFRSTLRRPRGPVAAMTYFGAQKYIAQW